MTARRSARASPGVYLVVKPGEAGLEVVSASRVPSVPRILLRRPRLDEARARTVRAPAGELVLAELARDGKVLESYGWPERSLAFFDLQIGELRGGLRGRPRVVKPLPRILRVPLGEEVEFLLFYGVRMTPREDGESGARRAAPLSLYYCGPGPTPRLAPPLPIPGEVTPQPLPWRRAHPRPRKGRERRH